MTRLSEWQKKEVININDGKILGFICDLEIDCCTGNVIAIIVPCRNRVFTLFKPERNFIIPWCKIIRIGENVVMVDIDEITYCTTC